MISHRCISNLITVNFWDIRSKGTILATYPAAELALEAGKYQVVSRDVARLAKDAARVIGDRLARPRQLLKTV